MTCNVICATCVQDQPAVNPDNSSSAESKGDVPVFTHALRAETANEPRSAVTEAAVVRLLLGTILVLGLVARLSLAWSSITQIFTTFMPDDAFYYFGIARNIAQGYGPTSDRFAPTNGYHPLWMAVLSAIYLLFGHNPELPIHIALTVASFIDAITAFVLFKVVLQATKYAPGALFAAALYFLNPYAIGMSNDGLETVVASLFLILSVWWYERIKHDSTTSWSHRAILGAFLGLSLLGRTDSVLVVAMLCLDSLVLAWPLRTAILPLLIQGAVTLAVVAPWLLWNLLNFGTLMQVSGEAYPYYLHQIWLSHYGSYFSLSFIVTEITMAGKLAANGARLSGFGKALPLAILYATLVVVRNRGTGSTYQATSLVRNFWYVFVGAILAVAVNGLVRWMILPWYYSEFMIAVALGGGLVARDLVNFSRKLAPVVVILLLVSFAVQYVQLRAIGWFPEQASTVSQRLPVVQSLCAREKVIGITDSGYYSYFAKCTVVNLDGVVNNQAYHSIRQGTFFPYLRSHNIHYVALNEYIATMVQGTGTLKENSYAWFSKVSP